MSGDKQISQRLLLASGLVGVAGALLIGVFGAAAQGSFPMMGAFGISVGKSISIDQAQQSVLSFLNRTGDSDLKINELMEFDQNFYALITEKSTGIGAFELLVNKGSGAVTPEPGPNMMWNTKYGMMRRGGMMGGFQSFASSGPMSVATDQATSIAQSWLDVHFRGDSAGTPDRFYGYYTFHFEKNGQIAGMLSVNGFTGQVWYHGWHGAFIRGEALGS